MGIIRSTFFLVAATTLLLFHAGCGSGKTSALLPLTGDQESIRAQLFERVDNTIDAAKKLEADLYSPGNFETGMLHYNNAELLLREERNIENIRAELSRASSAFERSIETTALGAVTFKTAIEARNNALKAEAPAISPDIWQKAEIQFRKAAEALEAGNVNRARREGLAAESQYRSAELESIKTHHLGEVRELLKEAEARRAERNAPLTLEKSRSLVRQTELLLEEDRYNHEGAAEIAAAAAYEATHALHLNQVILNLKNQKKSFEDVYFFTEEMLRIIARAVELEVHFHEGYEGPVREITAKLENVMNREKTYQQRMRQQENELSQLRRQLAERESSTELREIQRRREETINSISGMFDQNEGEVLIDGHNILIRLYGLNFPSGRSVVEPRYFGLLNRVNDAIKKFPGCRVIIEGHADSRETAVSGHRLSEDRASDVAEYIRAHIGMPLDLTIVGYGDTRSIAGNDTEQERVKNRRLDVVIIPGWTRPGR